MSTKATDDDEAAAAVAAAAVTVAVAAAIATAVFQRHIQALHCYRATLENLVILWNIPCCHCCVSTCTNCTITRTEQTCEQRNFENSCRLPLNNT